MICLLHGHSLGLAIDLASCADIRICTASTRFSVKEVDIGLAADIGTLTRLPKVVGAQSWVKDVCMSARIWGAEEAQRVGFVSRVTGAGKGGMEGEKEEALKEGIRMAAVMAEKSPVAVQGTKELLNYCRDRSVEDGLRYTAAWNAAMLQTGDVQEAMGAGMARRGARFEKL